MSKQDYVIQLLVSNEAYNGVIEQSLYDFLVDSLQSYFKVSRSSARLTVTKALKSLYVEAV